MKTYLVVEYFWAQGVPLTKTKGLYKTLESANKVLLKMRGNDVDGAIEEHELQD